MEIIWHGYACFEIVSGAYSLVLDPYRAGTNAGFPALDVEADEALCSHDHDGHGAAAAVRLRAPGKPSPFEIETLTTHHDVLQGEPEELAYSDSHRLTLTAEQRPDRLVLMLTPPWGSA